MRFSTRFQRTIAVLWVSAPALAFYGLLAATAVNVPYLDDYDTILDFLEGGRSIPELVAPHVEHRLAGVRSIASVAVALCGEVDFRLLAFWGNLGVLATAAVLYLGFRPRAATPEKLLAFAPASWFLFQPQYWDSFFWATSSLSNLWVLPISGLCFVCLVHRNPVAVLIAMLLATTAALTQANGLLCLPIGLGLLGLQHRGRAAAAWGVFAFVLGWAYASGLSLPDGHPGSRIALEGSDALLYALNFLGAAGGFGIPTASTLVGLAITASAVAVAPSALRRNPAPYALLLLIVASAILNALGREFISGPDYALAATRYRFYGSIALAVTYLAWAEALDAGRLRQVFVIAGVAAAMAFGMASYDIGIERSRSVSLRLERGMNHWQRTGQGLAHPDAERAHAILGRAIASGLYRPPAPLRRKMP